MEAFEIDPLLFFGVLEASILFLIVAAVFFVRGQILSGKIKGLKKALTDAQNVETPEPVSYEQYLRDEVLRNQGLVDQAAASEDDAEKKAGELLLMRKQFLELELEAHTLESNPVAFQECLAASLSELIEQLRPEAETAAEPPGLVEEPVESDTATVTDKEERATLDTKEAEFDRLKQLINNQHDAMEALRAELKSKESEIEGLDTILAKLDEFERHDAELQGCLTILDQENQQLKELHEGGGMSGNKIEPMDPAQLTGLKSMLGDQQQTIQNLQTLLQELAPETGKAKELENAITGIERANMDLSSCVAVLEDENANLRAELDSINAQLEQEALAEEAAAAETDAGVTELDRAENGTEEPADDEKQQLEIKVEELEALIEFKDAAIEELEKQYSNLEIKYTAATGEK
ncbi:hypothetical protein MNBD_GAMMA13-1743 [hydrothermal vent metagenome]|uniref:Uncharacterized protein n=1 Tax=hydrothermal vent metagenome TaxID=652676 RepID=A0A3B0YNC0_9ZZZZ